jgi:hypothetical protein
MADNTGKIVGGVLGAGALLGLAYAYQYKIGPFAPAAGATPASSNATAPTPPTKADDAKSTPSTPSAGAVSAALWAPMTRTSHDLKYAPGATVVTELTGKDKGKLAQSWSVGADGVTLTTTGPAVPMTPALAAQRDAARKAATPVGRGAAPAPGGAVAPGATAPGTPAVQALPSGAGQALSSLGQAASLAGQASKAIPGGLGGAASSLGSLFSGDGGGGGD